MQRAARPYLMCRSAEHVFLLPAPSHQHYLLRYTNQQLDRMLLERPARAQRCGGSPIEGSSTALEGGYAFPIAIFDLLDTSQFVRLATS